MSFPTLENRTEKVDRANSGKDCRRCVFCQLPTAFKDKGRTAENKALHPSVIIFLGEGMVEVKPRGRRYIPLIDRN